MLPCPAKRVALIAAALVCAAAGLPISEAVAQPSADTLVALELSELGPPSSGWTEVGDVWAPWDSTSLAVSPGTGVLVSSADSEPVGTPWEHGDLVLELDFMVAADATPVVYLQGRYGLSLSDSWLLDRPRFDDAGGLLGTVYARSTGVPDGHPPRTNASRAPGLWQHLRVVFRAPRFDTQGRKIRPARFEEVVLNGVIVQEAVAVNAPAPSAPHHTEMSEGPLVFDGGGLAVRNLKVLHVREAEPVVFEEVRYSYFEGEFETLSDFGGMVPARSGEARGFVWDLFGVRADRFGAKWEGTIRIPKTDDYTFAIGFNWIDNIPYEENAVPGQARFAIDGQTVLDHTGADSAVTGTIHLAEGEYPFTLSYFKNRQGWRPIVFFTVRTPGVGARYLNAERSLPRPEEVAPPMPVQVGGRPYVLRSFAYFGGKKKVNVASVGDPARIHYMVDLSDGSLLYAWRGAFVDAGPMWHERGQDQVARPLAEPIRLSDLAVVEGQSGATTEPAFRGYSLDASGFPTFEYAGPGLTIQQEILPTELGLERRVRAAGAFRVPAAEGDEILQIRPGLYRIDGSYYVDVSGRSGGPEPVVEDRGDRQVLLVPSAAGGLAAASHGPQNAGSAATSEVVYTIVF